MDKEHKIFTIPEVLEVILDYVDKESRQEAASVCRNFYKTICHLERNKSLILDKKIMNDEIYQSMLHSSRRFNEITVGNLDIRPEKTLAFRIGAVLEKFKAHARLSFCGDFESSGILNKIPDDSLEAVNLSIRWDEQRPNEEHLQDFLNRQQKLKKLGFPEGMRLVLGHLDLEELKLNACKEVKLDVAIDSWLAATLMQQPALRVLRCGTTADGSMASIGSSAFKELQKLRNLETLSGSFSENLRGQLANLKELRVIGDASFLLQVCFPKLTRLKLIETDMDEDGDFISEPQTLGPDHIVALSRSATNLQEIEIRNNKIDYFPAIIESFPNLVTLSWESLYEGDLVFPPPTRRNSSLKELIIFRRVTDDLETPDAAIYQTIAMCPNLERISVFHISFSEHEILNLIQSHPRLTHFIFEAAHDLEKWFKQRGADILHPVLLEIINAFRNSPAFIYLGLRGIANFGDQLLEDALDGIEVEKTNRSDRVCDLLLSRKVDDPFKDFRKSLPDNFSLL